MAKSDSNRKTKLLVAALLVTLVYVYFSSPGYISIRADGTISGLINQGRELLQGQSFWEDQLVLVDEQYARLLDEPRRNAEMSRHNAEMEREMREMDREDERKMEQMYREFPDLRPTAAALEVQRLRDRADEIEYSEFEREMEEHRRESEEYRIERMNELSRIRPLIDGKID